MEWKNIFINTAIVLVIIYWLIWAFEGEKSDFKTRNIDNVDNIDSLDRSLEQIQVLSERQLYFPKWRRCLIMSVILAISLSVLLFNELNMRNMLIILLCTFSVIYSFYNFYDYHYYKDIQKKIYIIADNIRRKNGKKLMYISPTIIS
jgi:hypothetical protein